MPSPSSSRPPKWSVGYDLLLVPGDRRSGIIYLFFGIWMSEEKLRKDHDMLPLHGWFSVSFRGAIWFLVSLTVSLGGYYFPKALLRLLAIISFMFAGTISGLSLSSVILDEEVTLKAGCEFLNLLGAGLLLLCTFEVFDVYDDSHLYAPLNATANGAEKSDSVNHVTPFAKAGYFSKMSFWWLNSSMKVGRENSLGEKDIPGLPEADQANSCYLTFEDLFNKQSQAHPSKHPSILWTIVKCHWKEIIISGFFALLKIVMLSSGPLFLNAFIEVSIRRSRLSSN